MSNIFGSFQTLVLAIADYFIPKKIQDRQQIFRARSIIFVLLVSATILGSVAIRLLAANVEFSRPIFALGFYILVQTSCLFGIKFTQKIDEIGTFYLFFVLAVTVYDVAFINTSLFYPGLVYFPYISILAFVVISDNRKRLFLIISSLLLTAASFLIIADKGLINYHAVDPTGYLTKLYTSHVYKTIILVGFMFSYLMIKRIAQDDMQYELNLKLSSAKFDEVSELVKKMCPELIVPLNELGEDLREFAMSSDLNRIRESRIQTNLEFMTELSYSLTWIYRACRNDNVRRISSEHVIKHLNILVARTVSTSGWNVTCEGSSESFDLKGYVPSTLLLVLSLVDQIASCGQGTEKREIRVTLTAEVEAVCFHICWVGHAAEALGVMKPRDLSKNGSIISQEILRFQLFQDLAAACQAEVEEVYNSSLHSIAIRGPWLATKSFLGP